MRDQVRLFAGQGAGWLVVFCMFLVTVSPAVSRDDGVGGEPIFSLDARDVTLRGAFERIGAMTGYQIEVSDDWADEKVTLHFVDVSLSEGLGRMLGGYNHFLLTDDDARTVAVRILGRCEPLGPPLPTVPSLPSIEQPQAAFVSGSILVLGGRDDLSLEGGVHPTEQEAGSWQSQGTFDPDDIEVVPPQSDGLRALTPREIAASEEVTPVMDVSEMEFVPPGHEGQ